MKLVKDKVNWYLDELVGELEQQTGKLVSIPTLWQSLVYCGISRKKLHQAAYERNELLRSTFIAKVGHDYKPEQLIFMDETSKDERTLSRRYGIIAVNIMEGSCTKEIFKNFVISNVSQMNSYPGEQSVLVFDNVRIHHDQDLVEYIEAFGGRVEFLFLIRQILTQLKLVFPL
ncbi:hypothetical protein RirG_027750 [Rhizophagus irregularis DAOM 197198w]|uniref:Tc1-like transposase DDE domain-containing protein n=1 Tax=Rhizophagus irregularis (strain DAOM 197198w) TaxID=1432141 RepID=A0A015KBR4_RHIIW|nr:hypothetical protein RirG_027750 [Rhizophagus irregularis DAOM 197198w]